MQTVGMWPPRLWLLFVLAAPDEGPSPPVALHPRGEGHPVVGRGSSVLKTTSHVEVAPLQRWYSFSFLGLSERILFMREKEQYNS